MLDEPLHGNINVHLVLGRDRVAAHLPVLNGLEVTRSETQSATALAILEDQNGLQGLDDILDGGGALHVVLVSEDKNGNAGKLGLVQKVLKLSSGSLELFVISAVHHEARKITERRGEGTWNDFEIQGMETGTPTRSSSLRGSTSPTCS